MNQYSIFQLIVILIVNLKYTYANELCWNNDNVCNIKTELFQNLEFVNGISMQIDCLVNLESREEDKQQLQEKEEQDYLKNDHQTFTNNKLLRRFMGIQSVKLDGCQTPLNTHTYGMEYLPICVNITKASISHFHMDTLIPLRCNVNAKEKNQNSQLEYLHMQFNEIAALNGESFKTNYPQLRDLLIESNSLKAIQSDTFKSLRSLENLRIVNEPVLMLKFRDLFEYTSVLAIHLEALKQMTSEIFHHLPETLKSFYVADTPIDTDAVVVSNALVLKNLTITKCALQKFTLHDVHSTVKRLVLSGNIIKMFTAYENDLKELDLSYNELEYLPFEWLKNLTNLETLLLKGNQIKILSFNNLLHALPNGHIVDISNNRIQSLQDCVKGLPDLLLSQVRLKCDRNPWDCLWLHDFAHQHPEKFRILQYEKFISKINVNGLECIPADEPLVESVHQKIETTSPNKTQLTYGTTSPEKVLNISAYNLVYGNPWEFKRNQRAEALIIVFMLPLGIALLFLLLYMWIYCQKIFHLSYYQNFSCMRSPAVPNPSQRFDVVRQVPPTPVQTDLRRPYTEGMLDGHDEGYEVPLNGVISECNCKAHHNTIEKCNKTIHITYEDMPIDETHRIYEEIIHGGQNHITYDHLSFE